MCATLRAPLILEHWYTVMGYLLHKHGSTTKSTQLNTINRVLMKHLYSHQAALFLPSITSIFTQFSV